MPFQTFAHGGATVLAMDRPRDDGAIIGQRTNERMLFQERQRLLLRRLSSQELPHGTESPTAVRESDFAGFFQGFAGMLLRQREQPLQHPRAFDAAGVDHRLRPLPRERADDADLVQQIARRRVPGR